MANKKVKKTIKPVKDGNNHKPIGKKINLTNEKLLDTLKMMTLARAIDNQAMNFLRQGKTFFHIAGAGHEAIQAALGLQLDKENDWFFPYYRDLTLVLYSCVTPKEFFLQCFAKESDPASGGRQLPSHWGSRRNRLVSQSSPTGTQFLHAVGTALSSVKQGEKRISYVSSGEGTTSQGEFHEAVNWASREKLPVLFVVQNNKYAISVPVAEQSGGKDSSIAAMMEGFHNLKRITVNGTDFFESYESVSEAIKYIKSGKGPALIEAECVRLHSHSSSDDQKKYRPGEELEEDLSKCPNQQLANKLIEGGILSEQEYNDLKKKTAEEVSVIADEALVEPDPDPNDAARYVFDESGFNETLDYEKSEPNGSKIVMVDAINHTLHEEMKRNDKMYIFGEDIADGKGGVFTATKGLSTAF
ncbi:MAG: thiamine pyrophosphate-dependent enzyme, partial [Ignavibacteria bacterium]